MGLWPDRPPVCAIEKDALDTQSRRKNMLLLLNGDRLGGSRGEQCDMSRAGLFVRGHLARTPALVVCAVAIVSLAAPGAEASGSTGRHGSPGPAPITWLAAGDSYSSGQGLAHTSGACARGDSGVSLAYPIQAYDDLRKLMPELKDPYLTACSGAVIANYFNAGDAERLPEWRPAGSRYDLVTFTFGGNTVDFSGVISQCVLGPFHEVHASAPGHKCPENAWVRQQIAQRLGAPFVAFLREVAGRTVVPGGNVVVLGYPYLMADPASWPAADRAAGSCQGITVADAYQLRSEAADLNATIARDVAEVNAEQPNGVHLSFLDVNSGGRAGPVVIPRNDPLLFEPAASGSHNLCGSGAAWMNGIDVLDLNRSFHPLLPGYVAEGHLLAQVLLHLDWRP
jgi:hypothetical protein